MRAESIKSESSEPFSLRIRGRTSCDEMACVEARANDEESGYKFPKIASKRLAKGSADCAGEGEAGEAGAS